MRSIASRSLSPTSHWTSASTETTCSHSLLATGRTPILRLRGYGRSYTSRSRPTVSGNLSGKWPPSSSTPMRISGVLKISTVRVHWRPSRNPAGPSYVVEVTSAGWQATRLEGLDQGSNAEVHGNTVAIAGEWRSPTTVALVRKNAAGQWANVSYAVGNPGSRSHSPEIAGPHKAWVAATEIGATGDEYEPAGQPEDDISDVQVFDLIGGSWRVTTLPRRNSPHGAVINDRLALQMDEWTEPGDIASYFVRDAAGAWTVQHSLLSDEHTSPFDAVFTGDGAFASISGPNGGEIAVFRREAQGRYRHEATLSPSNLPRSVRRPAQIQRRWGMGRSVWSWRDLSLSYSLAAAHAAAPRENLRGQQHRGLVLLGHSRLAHREFERLARVPPAQNGRPGARRSR